MSYQTFFLFIMEVTLWKLAALEDYKLLEGSITSFYIARLAPGPCIQKVFHK